VIDAVKTVVAAFFGVRRHSSHERDTAQIRPVHIAVTAIVLVALFIGTLLTIVRFVVG
jgi:hypothetical protein